MTNDRWSGEQSARVSAKVTTDQSDGRRSTISWSCAASTVVGLLRRASGELCEEPLASDKELLLVRCNGAVSGSAVR